MLRSCSTCSCCSNTSWPERRAKQRAALETLRPSAAISSLVIDDGGLVRALTRDGALLAQTRSGLETVIPDGVRAIVALPGNRMLVALGDGAILIESLDVRTLSELKDAIVRWSGR